MVITSEFDGARVGIHVDPGSPTVWRNEPYYSDIKQWAQAAAAYRHQLLVYINKRVIVMLPGQEVDLGIVHDDEQVATREIYDARGRVIGIEALKLKNDDPLIAGVEQGVVHHRPYQKR